MSRPRDVLTRPVMPPRATRTDRGRGGDVHGRTHDARTRRRPAATPTSPPPAPSRTSPTTTTTT